MRPPGSAPALEGRPAPARPGAGAPPPGGAARGYPAARPPGAPARRPRRDAHLALQRADLHQLDQQLPAAPAADPNQPSRSAWLPRIPDIGSVAAPPCPAPDRHATHISYSLYQRITTGVVSHSLGNLTTPRAAAPTDIAVGPEVAKDVLDLGVHTWRAPHARRGRRHVQARVQALPPPAHRAGSHRRVRARGGGPAGGAPGIGPRPHNTAPHSATAITYRTHFTNEPKIELASPSPGYLTTPSAAARALLPSPSRPSRACQAINARTEGTAPAAGSRHPHRRFAPPRPNQPRTAPRPRATTAARSPSPTRRTLPEPRTSSYHPSSSPLPHRVPPPHSHVNHRLYSLYQRIIDRRRTPTRSDT